MKTIVDFSALNGWESRCRTRKRKRQTPQNRPKLEYFNEHFSRLTADMQLAVPFIVSRTFALLPRTRFLSTNDIFMLTISFCHRFLDQKLKFILFCATHSSNNATKKLALLLFYITCYSACQCLSVFVFFSF